MLSKGELIQQSARRLGIDPLDWANVISYETIGSFDPQKRGGKDNKYVGLIQMGPEERKTYGGGEKQSFEDNLRASERYMVHRGLKPGMNLLDIYSTVNAGSPGHYSASDGHNTVAGHVQEMSGEYRKKAAALLGEQYHPSEDAQLAQRDLSPTELTTASTTKASNRLLAPAYGPSTIIGGMSNEPMNSPNRLLPSDSGAPEDNLDTAAWATKGFGIAAPTVSPVSDTVNSPVTGARPVGALDQPVTENTPRIPGLVEPGNIDLANRPQVANKDGSISTVDSMSFNEDGKEVLIPKVSPSGAHLTPEGAIALYRQTGQHLGKFDSIDSANSAAEKIHEDQAKTLQDGTIRGSAGTNVLPGGENPDDELGSIVEGLDKPAPGHSDELESIVQGLEPKAKVEIPSPSARIGPAPAEMGGALRSAINYGVGKMFMGAPIGQTFQAAGEDIAQYFNSDRPQYSHAQNYQRVLQAHKDYEQAHPLQALGAEAVGSIPSTMVGLGTANKLLGGAGKLASKLGPKVEEGVNMMGDFFSGRSGAWGKSAGEATTRVLSKVATGALEGGANSAMQSQNHPEQSILSQTGLGTVFGGALGVAGSIAQKAIQSPALSAVAPGVREVIDRAQRLFHDPEAVPLGGNVAMNEATQTAHKRLLAGAPETKNLQAYTGEVINSFGGEGKDLTAPVLKENSKRIGSYFDAIADEHIPPILDRTFKSDLYDLASSFLKDKAPGAMRNKLDKIIAEAYTDIEANGGKISGEMYQSLTKHNSELGKIIRSPDSDTAEYGKIFQGIIDSAVDRAAKGAGADMVQIGNKSATISEHLADARQQWRNLQIASDAFERGAPSGTVNPEKLAEAAKVSWRGGRHSNPDDHMQALVDSAPYMPKVTPQGAAEIAKGPLARLGSRIVENVPGMLNLGALGGAIGLKTGGLYGAAAGAGAGMALGASRDIPLRKIMSNPKYMNFLLGDKQAVKDLAGTGNSRRVGLALTNPLLQEYRGR